MRDSKPPLDSASDFLLGFGKSSLCVLDLGNEDVYTVCLLKAEERMRQDHESHQGCCRLDVSGLWV